MHTHAPQTLSLPVAPNGFRRLTNTSTIAVGAPRSNDGRHRAIAVVMGGPVVCERSAIADRAPARLRGLLGKDRLAPGDGLLIRPAASIHTFFMRFAIDAVFLDGEGRVLRVAADLAPWRAASRRGARAVLELAAGECARRGLKVGDRLEVLDSERGADAHAHPQV